MLAVDHEVQHTLNMSVQVPVVASQSSLQQRVVVRFKIKLSIDLGKKEYFVDEGSKAFIMILLLTQLISPPILR